MYGNKHSWLHQNDNVVAALDIFRTLVKFRIVEPLRDTGEWTIWYGTLRRFVDKYEIRK